MSSVVQSVTVNVSPATASPLAPPPSPPSSLLRALLSFLFSLIVRTFFRTSRSLNSHHIPSHGACMIVCAPHANQFIDPMVVQQHCPRQIGFLSAQASMKRKFIGPIIKATGAIGVSRPQDSMQKASGTVTVTQKSVTGVNTAFTREFQPGCSIYFAVTQEIVVVASIQSDTQLTLGALPEKPLPVAATGGSGSGDGTSVPTAIKSVPKVDQSAVYAAVYQEFLNGGCVGIFPEGGSHDRTELLPIKAGVSIMVLGAMSAHPSLNVKIIPAGLNYFNGDQFRSEAFVEFGEPIVVDPVLVQQYTQGGTAKREACNTLLTQVLSALNEVTLSVPTSQDLSVIRMCRRIYPIGAVKELAHMLAEKQASAPQQTQSQAQPVVAKGDTPTKQHGAVATVNIADTHANDHAVVHVEGDTVDQHGQISTAVVAWDASHVHEPLPSTDVGTTVAAAPSSSPTTDAAVPPSHASNRVSPMPVTPVSPLLTSTTATATVTVTPAPTRPSHSTTTTTTTTSPPVPSPLTPSPRSAGASASGAGGLSGGYHISGAHKVRLERLFADAMLRYRDEPSMQVLRENVLFYIEQLRDHALTDVTVAKMANNAQYKRRSACATFFILISRLIRLILITLCAIPGLLLDLPVGLIATRVARRKAIAAKASSNVKIEGRDVLATWKVMIAGVCIPLIVVAYSVAAVLCVVLISRVPMWVQIVAPIATFFLLPVWGYCTVLFVETGYALLRSLSPLFWSMFSSEALISDHNPASHTSSSSSCRPSSFSLLSLRAALQSQIIQMVRLYGPRVQQQQAEKERKDKEQ